MAKFKFNKVGGLKPRRNLFDLSYQVKGTCDMGQLIPVQFDEVVPGDTFRIGQEVVIRFQPLVAPILHEITATTHTFFVPYRLLWDNWENFITGGEDGTDASVPPEWIPDQAVDNQTGSLWDYFGLPIGWTANTGNLPRALPILDFPRRAYNFIWNEWYRDQDLQEEVPLTNKQILHRAWSKDYFTSARPSQQKGPAPAFPLRGTLPVTFPNFQNLPIDFVTFPGQQRLALSATRVAGSGNQSVTLQADGPSTAGTDGYLAAITNSLNTDNARGSVNLGNSITFNASDFRLVFQIQKWLERNMRAGTRYTEFLRAHFGVAPTDARLDRPEYIGGTRTPVVVSEVLQTSQSTQPTTDQSGSPQANMAGHGIVAARNFAGSYHVQEYGIILTLMSVMPKATYQNGVNRQWLRRTKYDFYFPEFSHLSEQGIYNGEIQWRCFWVNDGNNTDSLLFGFQGRYDEMRVKHDIVTSELRDLQGRPNIPYWHLGRAFNPSHSNPQRVFLNDEFIKCVPSKRIFSVGTVKGLIYNVNNRIIAARPIPSIADPGLVDHF